MKLLFSFCSVTGLKVSLYVFGRFCQASPNRVEVIWPCNLTVDTAFLLHSCFESDGIEICQSADQSGHNSCVLVKSGRGRSSDGWMGFP